MGLIQNKRAYCCARRAGGEISAKEFVAFSALSGVRPTIETMPLERAADSYDKMMRNEARMVLTTGA